MRIWTLAICLVGLTSAGSAAQAGHGFLKHRAAYGASIPGNTAAYCPTCGSTGHLGAANPSYPETTGSSMAGQPQPPTRPYSYYVARPLGTARGYYGYGEDQFPYYGRPYGHPYDPWTWPYMTDSYQNSLNRYYDPPVK